jgi:hypothetical protein
MEITLHRKYPKDSYTIGNLYINGVWFCNTIEDKDRKLYQGMDKETISQIKVYAETAIPYGRYRVTLNVQSPKFSTYKKYAFCKGYLPRLLDVPGFDGILIHIGNRATQSAGCILVGVNREKGKVLDSEKTFRALYQILDEANKKGEQIWINIQPK